MQFYQTLNRSGKIIYAKKMLPSGTIISYQNEIAKRLTRGTNPNTYSYEGMAGRKKVPTQVIVAKRGDQPTGKKDTLVSIITKDGRHISSYAINENRSQRLEAENYWVLKKQNIKEN